MEIYRAQVGKIEKSARHLPYNTLRMPRNIPFIVDNIWEWTRPPSYPSRRLAAFASPTKGEALASLDGTIGEISVGRVILPDDWTIAQTNLADAKYHPDIKNIPKMLEEILGRSWFSKPLPAKHHAHLYTPGLSAAEVEDLVCDLVNSATGMLARESLLHAGERFWNTVGLFRYRSQNLLQKGEVFFEIPPEGYFFE